MRKGGVVNKIQTDLSEETLIRRILRDQGTTIEYVSRGTFGFIFKVTYRGTDASGFEDENKNPVNVFILKVQGIDMRMKRRQDPDPHKPESEYTEDDGLFPYSKQVNWDHHVVQEALLQQQVYVSSIEKGIMPPCPCILYYGSITASELEKYLKSYFVFEEYGQMPLERDYQHFRVAIIFMEYINGESLFNLSDELFWDQGLRNKAFRSYCTAIECGVLHRDPQPQNFLVSGDNVILIDFGSASKIISETRTFETLIQKAEKGNCLPLIQALKAKDPDNLLDDWLFEPTKHAGREIITTTLAPKTMLHEKKQACMDGRCDIKRRPLVGRLSLSAETIAENRRIEDERYAKMTAEAKERETGESERKKARCEEEVKENGYCSVMGGKRTRKTRRKKLKMRGGVLSNVSGEENRDQVYRILSHPLTKIEYMSRGKSGQIFKVTSGTDSGFVDEKKNPVRVFILKVQGIDVCLKHTSRNDPPPVRDKADFEKYKDLYPYTEITPWDELSKEVRLQQQVTKKALDKQLMPPCPSILFYESITAEEFESFIPGQFVYKVGEDRFERIEPIHSSDFNDYHMGIIFMEYVDGSDLSELHHKIYEAKVYEIESKALRAYCTALQCGVLQGDPKRHNFIWTKDDNIVLIDFGIARELKDAEVVVFDGLLQKAEAGNCDELRLKLSEIEKEDGNPCIDQFIFRERWKGPATITTSGITKYPTLAPPIRLSKEVADQCKVGLYNPTPTFHDREKMAYIQRQSMEAQDRIDRAEAEKEELRLYSEQGKKPRFWGGKRKGTRRKIRTRRKI